MKIIGTNLTSRYDTRVKERVATDFYPKSKIQNLIESNIMQGEDWYFTYQTFLDVHHGLRKSQEMIHSIPSYSGISVGGAVATGSHGNFSPSGSISNQVTSIISYLPTGEIMVLNKEDSCFSTLSCSYGAGAVLCAVRLKKYDSKLYKVETEVMPYQDFIDTLANIVEFNESCYANIHFLGRNQCVIVTKINRVKEEFESTLKTPNLVKAYSKLEAFGLKHQDKLPSLVKQKIRLEVTKFKKPIFFITGNEIHNSLNQDALSLKSLQRTNIISHEVSFDLRLSKRILESLCYEFIPTWRKYRSTFPINLRISGADNSYLSPSFGRKSLWIDFVIDASKSINSLIDAEKWHLKCQFQGRPHPGKFYSPQKYDYPDIFPSFSEALKDLAKLDPKRVFYSKLYDVT